MYKVPYKGGFIHIFNKMTKIEIITLFISSLSLLISCFLLFLSAKRNNKRMSNHIPQQSLNRRIEKLEDDCWQLSSRISQQSKRIDYLENFNNVPVANNVEAYNTTQPQTPPQLSKKELKQLKYGKKKDKNTSSIQESAKPENLDYQYLAIADRKLVLAQLGQTAYYRCWHDKNKIFFEFSCDASKLKKAILNKDSIIAPCCIKHPSSVDPNNANDIVTVDYGELDENFQIINRTTIKFI